MPNNPENASAEDVGENLTPPNDETAEGDGPKSVEEEFAAKNVVDYFVERIHYLKNAIEHSQGDSSDEEAAIRRYETYIEAARSGNFFRDVSSIFTSSDGKQRHESLIPIYSFFKKEIKGIEQYKERHQDKPDVIEKADRRQAAAKQIIKSAENVAKSKLGAEFSFKRVKYIEYTGSIYVVAIKDGQEHHIPIGSLFAEDSEPPTSGPESSKNELDAEASNAEENVAPEAEKELFGDDIVEPLEEDIEDEKDGAEDEEVDDTEPNVTEAVDDEEVGTNARELTDDLISQARIAHLRTEAVVKAFEEGHKDPVNFLLKARGNHNMAERLRILGYDLSPPTEYTTAPVAYPGGDVAEVGQQRRQRDRAIIDMLDTDEGVKELKRELKAPSDLPLGLRKVPGLRGILGRIKMRRLARKVYLADREKRKEQGKVREDGVFGFGIEATRDRLDNIKRLNAHVLVLRSKLSRFNRHEYKDDTGGPKRDLAQQLHRDLDVLSALYNHSELHPADFYEHKPYQARLKEYRKGMDMATVEGERAEFIKLRRQGVRIEADQEKFENSAWMEHEKDLQRYTQLRDSTSRNAREEEEFRNLKVKHPYWDDTRTTTVN
jgi:hypothetical protein